MTYEPLHHKYRPQTFGDLVGQSAIAQTLINAIQQEKIAPAYLFTGPRGTGKTSSARILAKSLNCLKSNRPTPNPCGECEVCKAIAVGTALDIIEIDAASNTGVDNIREIIERSQFAPVQSRYKVYAIDECLTGDSLIQTDSGLMRIDDPNLKGKLVLSYNENTQGWEYKKVLRWLERGTKETLAIKTSNHLIRCTKNHLIRTDQGWIKAGNVKEGMKILSPANVDAEEGSINTGQMESYVDFFQDISLKGINTEVNNITSTKFLDKQKGYNPCVNADVTKNLISLTFSKEKEKASKASNLTGKGIHTEKVTDSGILGDKISLTPRNRYKRNNWDLYTEHYWVTEVLNIPTHTVDFLDYVGHMGKNSKNGWTTKQVVYSNCVQKYRTSLIEDMVTDRLFVTQPVTLNYKKFTKLLNQIVKEKLFHGNGSDLLHEKDLPGGIWMTVLYNLVPKEVLPYFFTLKDFLNQKIKSLLTGLRIWDILLLQNPTPENPHKKPTTTSNSKQNLVENGYQIYKNTRFPQWITNLEKVEFVRQGGHEKVYDLEVEDNHNFVANGLLVHNCHMLSTAAFNALLKTLEEPPPRVVFILATTDPQRVLPTIISRCQRFDYRRIPLEEMVNHLKYIARQEKIDIDSEAIRLVGQVANGGLRDAESLLDQLSLFPEKITIEQVWDLVGAIPERDLLSLLQEIRTKNFGGVLNQCRNLLDRGREPITVLQNLASFYLNLLIAQSAPKSSNLVAVTEDCWTKLKEEATLWQQATILWGQQKLKEAETQIKNTTQPRLWLEVTLLGLLSEATVTSSTPQNIAVTHSVTETVVKQKAPSPTVQPVENKQETLPEEQTEKKVVPLTPTQPIEIIKEESPVNNKVVPITKNAAVVENPSTSNSDVDIQTIWQKAIAILQPPTTRSLLNQKCHLIALEGSQAIIGISAPPLLRLLQGKAANIEAAFTQVCQRKIKVTLEIASSQKTEEIRKTGETRGYGDTEIRETRKDAIASDSSVETISNTEVYTPVQNSSITQHGDGICSVTKSIPRRQDRESQTTLLDGNRDEQGIIGEIAEGEVLRDRIKPAIPDRDSIPPTVETNSELSLHSEYTIDTESSEADFTKAVELIAQNFDGEVITLDNYFDDSESEAISTSTPDTEENLPLETTTNNGESVNNSSSIINRPDPSQYDDEDVPFARAINSAARELKLQDCWELAINEPGKWLSFRNWL